MYSSLPCFPAGRKNMSIHCCQPASEAVFVSEAAKVWDWFPSVTVFDRIIVVQKRATS